MQLAQPHASCGFSPSSQDSTAPPSPIIHNPSSSAPAFGNERQQDYRGGGSLGGGGSGMQLGAFNGSGSHSNDTFLYTQSRSSTGALVTGLTEKLNQKRIQSSMDFYAVSRAEDGSGQNWRGGVVVFLCVLFVSDSQTPSMSPSTILGH